MRRTCFVEMWCACFASWVGVGCTSSSTKETNLRPDVGTCVVEQTLSGTESYAYVPFAVGNRWTYQAINSSRQVANYSSESQQALVVTGTQQLDGTEVLVLADVNHWSGTTEEYLEVTPSGLINHGADADSHAPTEVQGAPPYTEVALPIHVCSVIEQFNATVTTDFGTGVVSSTAVERALERITVPAGTFDNSLRLERTLLSTSDVYGNPSGPGEIDITDWYAPGLGRIKRLVRTTSTDYSYVLIGSLVDGVGRGVVPLANIATDVVIDSSYSSDDVRPAVLHDGSKFFVIAATTTDFQAGGLRGVFVAPDGTAAPSFQIIDKIGAPVILAAAYGDGRYLVAYRVMNGAFYGLLVSADGASLGSPFQISKGTSGVDVAYGAGVFMVAHTDSGVLTLTPITPQGKLLTDSQPYPTYPNQTQTVPAIAFDGSNFLVVWENLDTERCTHISAGRLDGLGRAIDVDVTLVSSVPDTDEDVDVAFDGTNYVIAWFNRPIQPYLDEGTIRVARVSTDGILLDGPATMGGRVVSTTDSPRKRPRIARLGSQTMVVWEIGPLQSGLLAYRIVGTRISIDGTALDTATGSEGLWLSALMEGMSPQPMVPEIAFGGDRSLMVYVSGQSDGMLKLADTVIYPW